MKIEQVWKDLTTEKVIGQGSYGTVYKCYRENNGEKTYSAVKVITIPQTGEEYYGYNTEGMTIEQTKEYYRDIVDDFTNEIRILESLKGNANIVEIRNYEVIEKTEEIGWEIFIEMELLTDFNTYAGDKVFTEEEVLKLGTDLCNALYVCNEKNIIHRDIKPENIFVSENGDFKLGDFGVSRQLEKTDASMSRKGTFNYMAPEVFYSKKYDSRADVYSLGLVMYKLLNNNRMPFLDAEKQIIKYSERQEAFDKRINGEKIPPLKGISDELNEVIMKACEYKAEDRYNNAEDFRKALENKKLTGASGWVYRYRNILRIAVVLLVVISLSASIVMAVKFGKENDKNIIDTVKDSVTEFLFADFMVSGKAYTSEPVKGVYVYANKNGVFTFAEETEKTTQIYDKSSAGPAYDGKEICFVSENNTAIYKTKADAESPEKIFSNTEISFAGVVYFDSECVIAASKETKDEAVTYSLIFIDVASATYEKIADLGDDIYTVYADGNIIYLNNSYKGASGCEMYSYNIGNRESVLIASDAYADEDFATFADSELRYLSKENDETELKLAVCNLDGSEKKNVTDEIEDCKDIVYIDKNKIFFTSNKDESNIYDIKEKTVTPVKEYLDKVHMFDGKYYAFEKFDDGYRLNEVRADGKIKASMYTDNIKNKFDVIMLKKDKFLSWNTDSATVASVKTNGIDPLLIEADSSAWSLFKKETMYSFVYDVNESNYDCQKVDFKSFLYNYFLENNGYSNINYRYFGEGEYFSYNEVPDPKQRFKFVYDSNGDEYKEYLSGEYVRYQIENIKWICENIFNVDFEQITDFSTKENEYEFSAVEGHEPYFYDGYLYVPLSDGGDGGYDLKLENKIELADGRFLVTVGMYDIDSNNEKVGEFELLVGYKNISGKKYWSLYRLQVIVSISELQELHNIKNEDSVVHPNKKLDYFTFIENKDGYIIGVKLFIAGDYTGYSAPVGDELYGTVDVRITDDTGVEQRTEYRYESNKVIKNTYTTTQTTPEGDSEILTDTIEIPNYESEDIECNKEISDGYATVAFYFDELYEKDENIYFQVNFEDWWFTNNSEGFVNYGFTGSKFGNE